MSASGLVQATSPAQGVRLITFTRPEKRNALSRQLLDEFLVELEAASTDPAVKAIVITGTGTFFSGEPLGQASSPLAYQSHSCCSTLATLASEDSNDD